MGGRGASSSGAGGGNYATAAPGTTIPNNAPVADQAPSPQNTPIVPNAATALTKMSDQQLAQLYNASRTVDMPNHLKDVSDATQKFVYAAGVNEKPTVLDDAAYMQYLKDNNIPLTSQLARSTGGANYTVNGTTIRLSAQQVTDLTKYGDLNYIGGKHGGMAYGAGTYFDQNGGKPTGYASGGQTMVGVLGKNAKTIDYSQLRRQTSAFQQSHPQFAAAVGSFTNQNASIYALAQGYNVITDSYGYFNVIDRAAIVLKKSNY